MSYHHLGQGRGFKNRNFPKIDNQTFVQKRTVHIYISNYGAEEVTTTYLIYVPFGVLKDLRTVGHYSFQVRRILYK
jgi:hypothetical protein